MRKLIFITGVLLLGAFALKAQSKQLKKADRFYKNNHFAEAIPLYQKVLKEKNTTSIKLKLANSYRKLNQLEKAVKIYGEVVRAGKARPHTYYDYGVSLMGTGAYDLAKSMFEKYVELKPEDEKGKRMLQACTYVENIKPMFSKVMLEPFSRNSTSDDYGPIFFQDGISFSSDRPRGVRMFKEKSGMTGREYLSLYFSQRNQEGDYGNAKPFPNKINAVNKNAGPATFSGDGLTIVFTRNGNEMSKKRSFNMQLFEAQWVKGKWKHIKKVNMCSKEFNYMHPALSNDGNELYFASDKRGSMGGTDIFVSKRQADGSWGKPKNLGSAVNTPQNEGFPYIDAKGRLFFCSKGHFGYGGFDIFSTQKGKNGWLKPTNLGEPINSSHDDIGFTLSSNGKQAAFSSTRGGIVDNIYLFEIKGGIKNAYEANEPSSTLTASKSNMIAVDGNSYDTSKILSNKPIEKKRSLAMFTDKSNRPKITGFNDLAVQMSIEGIEMGKTFDLDARFERSDYGLNAGIEQQLEKLIEVLEDHTRLNIEIGAHTSSLGEAEDNEALSAKRAEVAMAYLLDRGIVPERVSARGYGENQVKNHCTEGIVCTPSEHAVNERLMFTITRK